MVKKLLQLPPVITLRGDALKIVDRFWLPIFIKW